jgi:hypothetical protein
MSNNTNSGKKDRKVPTIAGLILQSWLGTDKRSCSEFLPELSWLDDRDDYALLGATVSYTWSVALKGGDCKHHTSSGIDIAVDGSVLPSIKVPVDNIIYSEEVIEPQLDGCLYSIADDMCKIFKLPRMPSYLEILCSTWILTQIHNGKYLYPLSITVPCESRNMLRRDWSCTIEPYFMYASYRDPGKYGYVLSGGVLHSTSDVPRTDFGGINIKQARLTLDGRPKINATIAPQFDVEFQERLSSKRSD